MGKSIDNRKNIKLVLVCMLILALILAAVLLAIERMGSSSEVMAENSVDTVDVNMMEIDDSADHAKELYDSRVEDINDTAAVADLLKVMDLESIAGKFTTTIAEENGVQVLSVSVATGVQKTDKRTFDDNMTKCSQQLMALMPAIGKIQWIYPLISAGAEDESVTVSIDTAGASEQLKDDISAYGKSAASFEKLLKEQAE